MYFSCKWIFRSSFLLNAFFLFDLKIYSICFILLSSKVFFNVKFLRFCLSISIYSSSCLVYLLVMSSSFALFKFTISFVRLFVSLIFFIAFSSSSFSKAILFLRSYASQSILKIKECLTIVCVIWHQRV